MNNCYLIIDQGGHSTRALIYQEDGTLLFSTQHSVAIQNPKEGYYQQSINELLHSVDTCLNNIPQNTWQIKSAALITQRSSLVACYKERFEAMTPLISWQDTRNHAWLQQQIDANKFNINNLKELSGLRLNAHYGASKIRWLLDHNPAVQQAEKENNLLFLPLAAYLARYLAQSKQAICDGASASRTFLTEKGSLQWSKSLLELFDIDKSFLPTLVPTEYTYGNIRAGNQRIPLTMVGGDQNFLPFAYGSKASENSLFLNAGTGAFIQCHLPAEKTPYALLSSAATIDDTSFMSIAEGTVNACASAIDWLWQQHSQTLSIQQIEEALNNTQDPPVFFHRISALGSPYWLPAATSSFSEDSNLETKAVAIYESIIFLLSINIDLLKAAQPNLKNILISGGVAKLDQFCQKLADLTNLTITRHKDQEASARGVLFYLTKTAAYSPKHAPTLFHPKTNRSLLARYQVFYEWLRQEWLRSI